MLKPAKRTALDGKEWWVAYDCVKNRYSTDVRIGKYLKKKDCQARIDAVEHEDLAEKAKQFFC